MTATIELPQSILKRLEALSATSRLKPKTLVAQAVKERLDYEEWKAKKVRASLASVKAGKSFGKEEFWAQLAKARNARKKTA
jgi:predicted transcriptional regulator